MIFRVAIVVGVVLLLTACGHKSVKQLVRRKINVAEGSTIITLAGSSSVVKIQYLGSGGLFLAKDETNIFVDPYFSSQSFLTLARAMVFHGKIKSSRSSIQFGKQRIVRSGIVTEEGLKTNTKAMFSAHAHYDHLMDFPLLFNEWFTSKPNLYVNLSGVNSIKTAVDESKLVALDSIASSFVCEGKSLMFKTNDGNIVKVYPILAAHNPHIGDLKFFSGSLQATDNDFQPTKYKSHSYHWLEGNTMSFLIDIERAEEIQVRIFIQSSSCEYPNGLPPSTLLAKRKVDVAFLGVASYHASEGSYPSKFLAALNPQKIVFIHWEDFFRSYKKEPKTVPATDVIRFFTDVLPAEYRDDYYLPKPGTLFEIRY